MHYEINFFFKYYTQNKDISKNKLCKRSEENFYAIDMGQFFLKHAKVGKFFQKI